MAVSQAEPIDIEIRVLLSFLSGGKKKKKKKRKEGSACPPAPRTQSALSFVHKREKKERKKG